MSRGDPENPDTIASNTESTDELLGEMNVGNGEICKEKILHYMTNKDGDRVVFQPGEDDDEENEAEEKRLRKHAITTTRIFKKGIITETELTIRSPHILNVLAEIVKYFPAKPTRFDEPLTLNFPYESLYHHWDELVAYKKTLRDEKKQAHLDLLLGFLQRELGDLRHRVEKMAEGGIISFNLLWAIFKPGCLVMTSYYEHPRLYRLRTAKYNMRELDPELRLELSSTDYDGKITARFNCVAKVKNSELLNPSNITKLSYFPLEFLDGKDAMLKRLEDRGKRWLQHKSVEVLRYDGTMLRLKGGKIDYFDAQIIPTKINGRCIIDTKTCMEENLGFKPFIVRDNRFERYGDEYSEGYDDAEGDSTENKGEKAPPCTIDFWEAVETTLCPPCVAGFFAPVRKWGFFFVDLLADPQWQLNAIDSLILPPAPKKVIFSLVNSHRFPETQAYSDQKDCKGKGLVFLLHGAPGTGKTLTAETVAEHTKRPLVVLTSGELGADVRCINKKVQKYLRYASAWGAIILIDEADVFVEARKPEIAERLQHNGVVSVFLRHLEYFQGIIFLTSNRYEGFDPAIKSRIHVSLEYSAPNFARRKILWEQMLSRIPIEELKGFNMETMVNEMAMTTMNGREIANSVSTLRTLAREDGTLIGPQHFEIVKQVWVAFEGSNALQRDGLWKNAPQCSVQ